MGWAVTTHNMPSCTSFEQAKKIWDDAPSYEADTNWGEHKRPLENKRMPHKAVVKHSGANLHAYSLCLYGEPLITYHEDGHIDVMYHESQSSSRFFWRMAPPGVHYWGGRNLLRVNTARGHEWYENSRRTYTLEPDGFFEGINAWKITSATDQRMRTKTNLKRTREVNKALAGFVMWWKGVEKLTGAAPYTPEVQNWGAHGTVPAQLPKVFPPEEFGRLMLLGYELSTIKNKLFDYYGARERKPIANDVRPIQRPRHWQDT